MRVLSRVRRWTKAVPVSYPSAEQADVVWKQFKPMMSALRDESIAGPFETPSTSYVSDKDDPHFGKGMYFGLSGSVDWIVEVFQKLAGLSFALHDPSQPAVLINHDMLTTRCR